MDFIMTFLHLCIVFSNHIHHHYPLVYLTLLLTPFLLPTNSAFTFTPCYFLYHIKHVVSYMHLLYQSYCRTVFIFHPTQNSWNMFHSSNSILTNRNRKWAMYGILNILVVWGSQHVVILICNQHKLYWHVLHSFFLTEYQKSNVCFTRQQTD